MAFWRQKEKTQILAGDDELARWLSQICFCTHFGVQILWIIDSSNQMVVEKMAHNARISSRIDRDLKQKGEAILAELGIKPSQAISMFYAQIVRQKKLPLDLRIPNDETIEAIEEMADLQARKGLKRFGTVKKLMDDLNS